MRHAIVFIGLILLALFGGNTINAQPVPSKEFPFKMNVDQYLDRYSAIAIAEMHRSHIPASITLAQGLLESGNGNSRLALVANNHFGIKCKKDWTGESIKEDDDEAQECFRKYPTAEDSYRDHSDFLMKGQRYAFLFDLEQTDYKGWAEGLKRAGYATNPNYPNLLISLIERHNLQRFDQVKPTEKENIKIKEEQNVFAATHTQLVINGIPVLVAKSNDSYASIALENGMRVWQIYKYNDLPKDAIIKAGDTIYIKPKNYNGSVEHYTVATGDNMRLISQRFGIKLSKLYKRNNMKEGQEPEVGEQLSLRGLNHKTPTLRVSSIANIDSTYNNLIYDDPRKNVSTSRPLLPQDEYAINITDNKNDMAFFHVVQKGETLFSIAKKYNVRVEGIMEINHLHTEDISDGTRLIINPNQPAINENEEAIVPGYHMVKQGETLYSIARKYNTTVIELRALNELTSDTLRVGDELVIVPLNGEKTDYKEPDLNSSEPIYHEVLEKETLYSIARKYNVLVDDIRKLNNMIDNAISVGQKLRIR
jgi:LysM repeat protein